LGICIIIKRSPTQYSTVLATDSAHYACEATVFLNGKYSKTTYIFKI